MKSDVFISYSHVDEEKARAIAGFLDRQGVRCWISPSRLRLAEAYDQKITQALRDCRVVLWVASKDSVDSDYVRHEISTAQGLAKPIGPIFLEPLNLDLLEPPFNTAQMRVHGIEYFRDPVEDNLATLLDDLRPLLRRRKRSRVAAAGSLFLALFVAALYWWTSKPQPVAGRLLPASVAALPAGETLGVVYTGAPPPPWMLGAPPQLEFEIAARRSGEAAFRPLEDGEELASEMDDYLILGRALSAGHLYVFQVDSSGKTEWIFPRNRASTHSSGSNPVEPGRKIQIPAAEQGRVLYLDRTTGIEHIYAVFSATPWPALEEALSRPSSSSVRPESSPPGQALLAMTVAEPNQLLHRGVGGTRVRLDSIVGSGSPLELVHQGKVHTIPVTNRLYQSSSWFLVVERWFKHVEGR